MSLLLFLALLPATAEELRIDTTGKAVKVVGRLPAEAIARLPTGVIGQDDGEKWLRFSLLDGKREGPPMVGTYERRDDRLTFVPRYGLQAGQAYRAHLGPIGKPLASTEYRVPNRAASPLAFVEKVYPSAEVLPANHLRFYLHFSAPMRGGKDIFNHIRILDAQGNEVHDPWLRDELWDENSKMLILYIHPGRIKWGVLLRMLFGPVLEPDQEYTLVIPPELLDIHGQKLGKEFRKKFRTTAEDRVRIVVEDWKFTSPPAGTRDAVVIAFPKIMDHSSLNRFLSIRNDKGETVAGKIDIGRDERSWSFRPTQPWQAGCYALTVSEELEDTAGNTPFRPFDMDRNSPRVVNPRLKLDFQVR